MILGLNFKIHQQLAQLHVSILDLLYVQLLIIIISPS